MTLRLSWRTPARKRTQPEESLFFLSFVEDPVDPAPVFESLLVLGFAGFGVVEPLELWSDGMLESFVIPPLSLSFLVFEERPTLDDLSLSLGLVVDVPPGPPVCADALMPTTLKPTIAATANDCTL